MDYQIKNKFIIKQLKKKKKKKKNLIVIVCFSNQPHFNTKKFRVCIHRITTLSNIFKRKRTYEMMMEIQLANSNAKIDVSKVMLIS